MAEHRADSPVTLIIRAPNQKYDDQPVSCFLDWTVEKLKKHITSVYPSKPLSREQRLVYSGRLLQDHQQLRDVLQKDEYHMVYLVCAHQNPPADPSVTSDPASTNAATSDPTPPGLPSNQNVPDLSFTGSTDGVHHRGGSAHAQQRPERLAPPAALPPHSVYSPVQMMWWQRVYAQQYYMHYQAAMAAAQATPPPVNPGPSVTPAPAPVPVNPAPLEQPANQNPQMNAQGGAMPNEDELNRDWLDWLYTVSRAAVLLSIVYFYSSFSRFVMVIGAMLLVYLHQAGWFPFRVELQNPGAADRAPAENDRNHNMQEMERIMDDGLEDDAGDSGDEGSDEAAPPQPSFLTSTWSFISTFFTSLVPEGPPRAAR
ncbi:homocysteine-responsive endoplasmic reticulum-resident ubiquitin-like domain member 2 protein isoform X2 [Hemibagrus wyckioides]|uniref:homocysteine-responsive endoplasmic reticulum-resident ubiquitin-like domain member 2 protein isoform X2 n=1 Tax=Hemibagrus wyckioides TaxID=337641 RepID=UPI00266C1B8F|nr:homocysteine-responsive endoplasmic reticulum-resident ubiquitin-like domain member 2 protein isoform X2 [Hemibagrus wyckioides]